MYALTIAFLVSTFCTLLILRYSHLHNHLSGDHDLGGVQKFHTNIVPRVGGVSVLLGVVAATLLFGIKNEDYLEFSLKLILAGLPAFVVGFTEDVTKTVGVKERLGATALSAVLAGWLLDAWLVRSGGIHWIDELLAFPLISLLVTAVAVAGVANAYNIIDGYNGLVGVVSILILLGLMYVARQVGDHEIVLVSMALIGAVGGFLVWNYPRGLIFLGDGGAYLIGFLIAELSVLLVYRNQLVSPWFPLLLNIYPVFETGFSIYRKKIKRGMSPGVPDGLHLHMLIYKRLIRWAGVSENRKAKSVSRNSMTSPYLWALCGAAVLPAMLFWDSTPWLVLFLLIFSFSYLYFYRMIVRVRVPKWLRTKV